MSTDIDVFIAPPATADELVARLAEFGIFVSARKPGCGHSQCSAWTLQ
jgi:hypothetical protein